MDQFFLQVGALLKKDLLLKKRRKFSLFCDCTCGILIYFIICIPMLMAPSTVINSGNRLTLKVQTQYDQVGFSKESSFPPVCKPIYMARSTVRHQRFMDSEDDFCYYSNPIKNMDRTIGNLLEELKGNPSQKFAKEFAVGPEGEIGDRLKEYFDFATKQYNSASLAIFLEIESCFKNTTLHQNISYEQCLEHEGNLETCIVQCAHADSLAFPSLTKRVKLCKLESRNYDTLNEMQMRDSTLSYQTSTVKQNVEKQRERQNQGQRQDQKPAYDKEAPQLNSTTRCEDISTPCDCVENNCTWEKTKRHLQEMRRIEKMGPMENAGTCKAPREATVKEPYFHFDACEECPRVVQCSKQALWKKVGKILHQAPIKIVVVSGNDDLDAKAAENNTVCGGVVFEKATVAEMESSKIAEYTLRVHALRGEPKVLSLSPDKESYRDGFHLPLGLQHAVDDFITCNRRNSPNPKVCLGADAFNDTSLLDPRKMLLKVGSFPFFPPSRGHIFFQSAFHLANWSVGAIAIMLGLIWSMHMLKEKEYKVKEAIRAHGVHHGAYYTSLFLFTSIWSLLLSIIPCLILKYVPGLNNNIGLSTSFLVLILLTWLALWNTYALVSFLTTFCKSAIPGAYFISLLLVVTGFGLHALTEESWSRGIVLASSLDPVVNWRRALRTVYELERAGFADHFSPEVSFFSLNDSVMMSFVAIVTWHVLFVYCDLVVETAQQPWYFLLSPSFWKSVLVTPASYLLRSRDHEDQEELTHDENQETQPATLAENDQLEKGRVIHVSNLKKRYGKFTAVNGINVRMYANEIFALLGHNGAGKTTTFSMLAGLTRPTSGRVRVFGNDLQTHLAHHRSKVGFCPQQNMIWPILTVDEHLSLFHTFKGVKKADRLGAQQKTDALLATLDLVNKKNAFVSTLSGGMVRKLCLAASFLGDPDVVFLDEPTSGLDATARREVWDVLRAQKKNRVIILSTHYMEEADVLADRIAIMDRGAIKCNGSPSFLREKYGCGYNLTCLMNSESHEPKNNLHKMITEVLDSGCPDDASADAKRYPLEILSRTGREVTFLLPSKAAEKFPDIIALLEKKNDTKVESYSVGVSSLEEVFIKVSTKHDHSDVAAAHVIAKEAGDMTGVGGVGRISCAACGQQMRAMLAKRFYYAKRNKMLMLCTVLMPVLFSLAGLLGTNSFGFWTEKTISLSTDGRPYQKGAPIVLAAGSNHEATPKNTDAEVARMFQAAQNMPEFNLAKRTLNLQELPKECPRYLNCTLDTNRFARYASDYASEVSPIKNEKGVNNTDTVVDDIEYMSYNLYRNQSSLHVDSRYGAFINPIKPATASKKKIIVMANLRARESPGMNLNIISNILLAHNNNSGRIRANKRNLPRVNRYRIIGNNFFYISTTALLILIGCGMMITLCFSLLLFEKDNGLTTQQFISGMRRFPYWLGNFCADATTVGLSMALVFVALVVAEDTILFGSEDDQIQIVILFFALYSIAQPLFSYAIVCVMPSASSASIVFFGGNVVVGPLILALFRLSLQGAFNPTCGPLPPLPTAFFKALPPLMCLLRFMPSYQLADGLWQVAYLINHWKEKPPSTLDEEKLRECKMREDQDIPGCRDVLDCSACLFDFTRGPGRNIINLSISIVLYPALIFLFTILTNSSLWKRRWSRRVQPLSQEALKDSDVLKEEAKVEHMACDEIKEHAICAKNIRKAYKSKKTYVHAVQGVSFAAQVGEVFGLLGVNGAGKSTMFKMLVGDLAPMPTGGSALHVDQGGSVGYCPQTDPLWSFMTVREHLVFMARLKGIPSSEVSNVVAGVMHAVDLTMYDNNLSHTLSGGNKRKLCVAMSLIGTPKILFLDEPSAGVDPVGRRFMWSVIQQISQRDRTTTVVLTTHSMEECEALCTRTAIMVNGVFRCIGPNSHIRNTYGKNAFTLDIGFPGNNSVAAEAAYTSISQQWAETAARSAILIDINAHTMTYAQLSTLCDGSDVHKSMLNSSASVFPMIAEFFSQKKQVFEMNSAMPGLSTATVSTSIALKWWHMCTVINEYIALLLGDINSRAIHEEEETTQAKQVSYAVAVDEIHGNKARLRVQLQVDKSGKTASIGDLFGALEKHKRNGKLEEYSLASKTLESIFNSFAREQVNNTSTARCWF